MSGVRINEEKNPFYPGYPVKKKEVPLCKGKL